MALGSTLLIAACCGDTEATIRVHVVDGANGGQIAEPVIIVEGTQLTCGDNNFGFQSAPIPNDDGGTVVPPPPGATDAGVPPPPSTHFCETWIGFIDAGTRTLHASAPGYFPTEAQVDLGSEGASLACPSPTDAELTVALYAKPKT